MHAGLVQARQNNSSNVTPPFSVVFSTTQTNSQISDGEPWGWFDEMEEVGGEGGGGAPAATPVTKPTPPYILTVSECFPQPKHPAALFYWRVPHRCRIVSLLRCALLFL